MSGVRFGVLSPSGAEAANRTSCCSLGQGRGALRVRYRAETYQCRCCELRQVLYWLLVAQGLVATAVQ